MPLHVLKGELPAVFEVQGFNSYNWDTVHYSLALGSRWILFLPKIERPDLFCIADAERAALQREGRQRDDQFRRSASAHPRQAGGAGRYLPDTR